MTHNKERMRREFNTLQTHRNRKKVVNNLHGNCMERNGDIRQRETWFIKEKVLLGRIK